MGSKAVGVKMGPTGLLVNLIPCLQARLGWLLSQPLLWVHLRVPDFCLIARSPLLSARVLGREQCPSVARLGVKVMIPR